MSIELTMLGWAAVLGLVHLLLPAVFVFRSRGLGWIVGNRDDPGAPLGPYGERSLRAQRNFLESFVLFAALVLAVLAAGKSGERSALAVQLYFWARLIYLPVYVLGVPWLRSLIWAVSLVAIVCLAVVLLAL